SRRRPRRLLGVCCFGLESTSVSASTDSGRLWAGPRPTYILQLLPTPLVATHTQIVALGTMTVCWMLNTIIVPFPHDCWGKSRNRSQIGQRVCRGKRANNVHGHIRLG